MNTEIQRNAEIQRRNAKEYRNINSDSRSSVSSMRKRQGGPFQLLEYQMVMVGGQI